ncbi:glycosyltransferase family 4 protein [Cerasibacillus sp. JNUCC 74]
MNIGFVSTWFERGAAYVTKSYIELLKKNHNVFVYARGGEAQGKGDPNWDFDFVTWGLKLRGSSINFNHFKKWIKNNKIDVIFFNEQKHMEIVYKVKEKFPNIKIGSYVDYYKENTIKEFNLFDFLICNTKRHYSVFNSHSQCFYVPWGVDTNVFKPQEKDSNLLTFFHSAGMSDRKGTSFVIDAFINGEIYKRAKLIIHTQKDFEKNFRYNVKELNNYNVQIIEKTVTAPGLYHLGDVYVYPTMLDGLGLTMYEALAAGLPVITTNHPPMSEVINNRVGYLVKVEYFRSRQDGYYWPLSIVKKDSLEEALRYFVNNEKILKDMKQEARTEAINKWNLKDREHEINEIFENSEVIVRSPSKIHLSQINKTEKIMRKIGSSYIYPAIKKIKEL